MKYWYFIILSGLLGFILGLYMGWILNIPFLHWHGLGLLLIFVCVYLSAYHLGKFSQTH